MLQITTAGLRFARRPMALAVAVWLAGTSAHAADSAKQACLPDAKRLCPAEIKMLSRSKVRACLIAHIDQTGPICHDFMVKARAQALAGHATDPSTQ